MRLQLTATALAMISATAAADDRAEISTTLFAEKREGGAGGLTVIHPQALFGVDLGRFVTLDLAWAADVVSGATASIYQVDAVSSATKFTDLRNEGTVSLGFRGRRSRIVFSGMFGAERDYISRQVGGTASIDLKGRNTTLALAYTHGSDEICNRDNTMVTPLEAKGLTGDDACEKPKILYGTDTAMTRWEKLSIDTAAATLTQNLSPTMNMQLSLFGQILEGFQSNPYRRVKVGQNVTQERIPDTRARWSLSARFNRYLPKLKAAAHFDGRFYDDTWGVVGGNLELGYSQYVGENLLIKVFARVYQQSQATFFKDAFFYETLSTAGEYYTGDRELSPVRNGALGGKVTVITIGEDKPVWGLFDKLQLNLRGEIMFISVVAADSVEDNFQGIDRQFIYGASPIDAVTLLLGLLGNY